ncbi:hypothetical protein BD779DRAFT_1760950 [Infundibulicybe gibba]|nr:hypothetical protein BD779DRAFT_1760950 [Infundibulicybe gibba]
MGVISMWRTQDAPQTQRRGMCGVRILHIGCLNRARGTRDYECKWTSSPCLKAVMHTGDARCRDFSLRPGATATLALSAHAQYGITGAQRYVIADSVPPQRVSRPATRPQCADGIMDHDAHGYYHPAARLDVRALDLEPEFESARLGQGPGGRRRHPGVIPAPDLAPITSLKSSTPFASFHYCGICDHNTRSDCP